MAINTVSLLDPSVIRSSPDWRRWWLAGKPHLINSSVPISPEELPDSVLREVLIPFFRRINYCQAEIGEREYETMQLAYKAYTNKMGSNMATYMEAWALAGMTESGEYGLMPCQRIYEAAFFDIRHCLDDVEMVVDFVLAPMAKHLPLISQEITGKVIAYMFGAEPFRRWMNRNPTPETIVLERQMEKLTALHASLKALGLPAEGAWSKALCRVLHATRNGKAQYEEARFWEIPSWQSRLERLEGVILASKDS